MMEKKAKEAVSRTYLVAAANHDRFLDWCRWHGINPYKVIYLFSPEKGKGRHDFDLVLLDGYQSSGFYEKDPDSFHVVGDRATRVYRQVDQPIVENGEIVGWQPRFPENAAQDEANR